IAALLIIFKGRPISQIVDHTLATLVYSHYFIHGERSLISALTWSLEIEVQFYVLAPLMACVFALRPVLLRRLLLIAAVLAIAFAQRYSGLPTQHGYTILHEAHYFLCGFILADLYCSEWSKSKPSMTAALCWDVAGLVSWSLLVVTLAYWTPLVFREGSGIFSPRQDQLPHVALVVLVTIACCAAFRGRLWTAILSLPALYVVGGMCYTIYLWHFVFMSGAMSVVTKIAHGPHHVLNLLVAGALILPSLLLVCSVLFVLFEKPFMRRDWVERTFGFVGMGKKKTG
ncbi:MAG: acyltransferase family protein, partial [Phycisphaerales bacterium]|nr:acyltransferase family protein [Phycisphaerales bacterium]